MQIVTLQAKDFKGLPNDVLDFTDNNRISGRNGAGKSSIAEAIVFALYGRTRSGNSSTSSLIHEAAESTKVAVQFDTGTTIVREESRFYGSRLELNGKVTDQKTLDANLPEYKTFLSIFLTGFFGQLDEADQRSLLLSFSPAEDLSKLFTEYTRKPELLKKYLIDFSNLDKEYKQYRKMLSDVESSITTNESRAKYAQEQISSLKKPKARIDIKKTQEALDLIAAHQAYEEALAFNSELAKQSAAAAKGICPSCEQPLSKSAIAERVKEIESRKREVPSKPSSKLPKATASELREKLSDAKAVNALFDNYEEQVLDLEKVKVDATDAATKAKEELANLSSIVEALSPKGIRAQAARQQIKPIITTIEKYIGEDLPVKIETLEQLKNGNMKEVFKIFANEVPYKFLSTGERKRVDIAISQAINELEGSDISVYFVDDAELISESFTIEGQVFKAFVSSDKLTITEGE